MASGALPDETRVQPRPDLPPITDESRTLVRLAESRRLALQGDQQQLRLRYEEVMRWANPPWDPVSRRIDPRAASATAARDGESILHVDDIGQILLRWAVLEAGEPFGFRVKPKPVFPPIDHGDKAAFAKDRQQYDLDRAIAQNQSTQMEEQTQDWIAANHLHRTLLWTCWSKRAFGKAIIRSGWDEQDQIPTAELMENPSQVAYAWTKRYGRRKLAWAVVIDQMSPEEANARFGIRIPIDATGAVDLGQWTALVEQGELDQQPEQSQANQRYVVVEEMWDLTYNPETPVRYCLIVGGRVIEGPYYYSWKRLPFHVFENEHIPTYLHGKSTAESAIILTEAYDTMLDRQQEVIEFESGPRYKGVGMYGSDETEVPAPFEMIPLRPDQDILQIDTRVDFFPTQLHAAELKDAKYKVTGLTPVAWGMSPNAQTSGRALSAEWKAVELPLVGALVNISPEVRELMECWWDYAEEYLSDVKAIGGGYRRFEILWEPFDIRDRTERTLDVIQRLNADILDPETAIQETGYENVDEILAKIRSWQMDPIANPLRYQQYLTLQQLELNIRQQEIQTQMMEQQAAQQNAAAAGPGAAAAPGAGQLQEQGAQAAAVQAQAAGGRGTEASNQRGALPIDTSVLSQTPLEGGIGNRAIVDLGGGPTPPPATGQVPR